MATPNKQDALHKAWLYRILEQIADDPFLPTVLRFKGGTCATMLGWLDRFSVDLDFDYAGTLKEVVKTRQSFERIFLSLGLVVKDASKRGIQFFLQYNGEGRKTIKIDTSFPLLSANTYASQRLLEIDRVLSCQTRETMFAHKLLALMGRQIKHGTIAGRDVYDIHHFFLQGYVYDEGVIVEESGMNAVAFFTKLCAFVEREVTNRLIDEDLNALLPASQFQIIRKVLKRETVMFLRDELVRLKASIVE
jgi:predicted nucleotidyltransferase component of viral defense system